MGRKRELERTQRLLRRLDLEEVLEDLGLEVVDRVGSDAYCPCPDPAHVDANPSFHVCVEDVPARDGGSLLGRFNCWSHPGEAGLRGLDFLDLVARVRSDAWDRPPTSEERRDAARFLRREYLDEEAIDADRAGEAVLRRREAVLARPEFLPLAWPPSAPLADAPPEFREFAERRGLPLARALELGVRAVRSLRASDRFGRTLKRTAPGIIFPIAGEDGEPANWFVRSIFRVPSREKGRYCPGVAGPRDAGLLWAPDPLDLDRPVALVEGILDAERVRALLLRNPGVSDVPFGNVVAVLGARLYPRQAARIRGAPGVIHLADGDAGGATLFESVRGALGASTRAEFRPMPRGTDPGDAPEEALLAALRAPGELERPRARLRLRGARRRA